MCTADARRCPLPESRGARLDLSTRNSFSSCALTAYFEIEAMQSMGLPLAPVLLHSAVASGLAVGRTLKNADGRSLSPAGRCSKTGPQGGVATTGAPRLAR